MNPVTFAKAMADDTRQKIMNHLCCQWLCVSDVVDKLGDVTQPTVSHHLAVLRLLVGEKTAIEMGQIMNVSERTVRSHLTNIYGKFGVESKAGAIREAVRLNLIPEE